MEQVAASRHAYRSDFPTRRDRHPGKVQCASLDEELHLRVQASLFCGNWEERQLRVEQPSAGYLHDPGVARETRYGYSKNHCWHRCDPGNGVRFQGAGGPLNAPAILGSLLRHMNDVAGDPTVFVIDGL